MPDKSEVSQLDKIEDLLIDMFGTEAILVMVITNGIMREFVLYAKEWKPEIYDAQLKKLSKKTRPHSIQFIMKKDVKWFTFKSLS